MIDEGPFQNITAVAFPGIDDPERVTYSIRYNGAGSPTTNGSSLYAGDVTGSFFVNDVMTFLDGATILHSHIVTAVVYFSGSDRTNVFTTVAALGTQGIKPTIYKVDRLATNIITVELTDPPFTYAFTDNGNVEQHDFTT